MPANTQSVTRPGKWGNPLKLEYEQIFIDASYRRKELDPWVFLCFGDEDDLVKMFEYPVTGDQSVCPGLHLLLPDEDLEFWRNHFDQLDLNELKGKDLACFCSPGKKCHAEVLLKLANQ